MQSRISILAHFIGTLCHFVGWGVCAVSLAADPQVWFLRAGADGDGTSIEATWHGGDGQSRTRDGDIILLIASDPLLRHVITCVVVPLENLGKKEIRDFLDWVATC